MGEIGTSVGEVQWRPGGNAQTVEYDWRSRLWVGGRRRRRLVIINCWGKKRGNTE